MIKVLTLVSRMNVGGPALLIKHLADNLPKDEFEHILITGYCQDGETDFLNHNSISGNIIYLTGLKRSIGILSEIKSFLKLIRILRELQPDIVHTHTSKAGFIGRIALVVSRLKIPVIHTYHGHLLYGYFPKIVTRVLVVLERQLAKTSTLLIAVTQQVKMDLLRAGIGRSTPWKVIYPGVFKNAELSLNESNFSEREVVNDFRVVWIGRFTNIKNPQLAILSIHKAIAMTGRRIALTMVGNGELMNEAMNLAKDLDLEVTFTGWQEDVYPILEISEILLLTSRNEGLPLVTIEAALCEIPTVSTDVGGVHEFVVNGRTGVLVQQNIDSVAEGICILTEEPLRKRLGLEARSIALKDFSVSKMVESHIEVYRSLLK